MANSLLLDIVIFLTNKKVVKGDGVDTFRDFIPDAPDSLVALVEYTGSPPVPYELAVHRSVQISARDKSADNARSKALEIFEALRGAMNEDSRIDFTADRWGQVSLRQTPFRLGTDKSDKVTYAFNVGVTTTID